MLVFFRNYVSLITDPHPRMAFFVLLGAFIMSYCVYEFLKGLECRYFEHHPDDEDTYEISIGSTTTITTASDMLWGNPVPNDNILDPYAVNKPSSRNSFKEIVFFNYSNTNSTSSINYFSSFQFDNQPDYTEEEYNLKKKEKLYLSSLNRSRNSK